MIKKILSFCLLLITFCSKAQSEMQSPQMADDLRQSGKIYVVITVIGIIFAAIVFFLLMIEKKLRRLEDEMKDKNN